MNHNELLNKLANRLDQTATNANNKKEIETVVSSQEEEGMGTILNKIGLEIQRQGGY